MINYGKSNIDSINKLIDSNDIYLETNYRMKENSSLNPINITKASRRKCVKGLVR